MELKSEVAKNSVSHLKQVETPCLANHDLKNDDLEMSGKIAPVFTLVVYILPQVVGLTFSVVDS